MDLISRKNYMIRVSQAVSPMSNTSQRSSIFTGSRTHSSDTSFPIIAIAIIGILATAFLLVSYYIFVIKCCLNWHRIDILRRFSLSRSRNNEESLMGYAPRNETRGLDESVIRSIPLFQFKKEGNKNRDFGERSYCECAVCLNEFQEDEKLRIIPNCSHVFHIDCIDIWLQNNSNCPLCRNSISSSSTTTRFPIGPTPSPQDPNPYTENVINTDEDFVVIELGNGPNGNIHQSADQALLLATQESLNSGQFLHHPIISPSPRKVLEHRVVQKKSGGVGRKHHHHHHKVTSMGDECIDIRGKDEQFGIIQPIRRSFSMDSSADTQLYLAVQEVVQQQNRHVSEVMSPIEGCSSRVKRSFFTFGSRGSRSSVLPVHLEQ